MISARTAAVGLASASLAAKGKDTLDQLEDTRQELRRLQEEWSAEQLEWRRERAFAPPFLSRPPPSSSLFPFFSGVQHTVSKTELNAVN